MGKSGGWTKHLDFIIIDILCLNLAFAISYIGRFGLSNPYAGQNWRGIVLVMTLINILVLFFGNMLSGILRRGYIKELFKIAFQAIVMEVLTAFYLYATHSGIDYSRIVIILTGIVYVLLTFVLRVLWKRMLRRRIAGSRKVLLVGGGEQAGEYVNALKCCGFTEYSLGGYLADDSSLGPDGYLGSPDLLGEILREGKTDEVVAALPADETGKINDIVSTCEKFGVRVSVIPAFSHVMSSKAGVEQLGDVHLLNFRSIPLDQISLAAIKRGFDIFASLLGIILTAPIMLICAVGTKLSSPGPILFRQERVGRNGRKFTMLKFRSMRSSGLENTAWSTDTDPRRTRFGSFMRKCSLDELPQFFNVFAGQMSLIGPRPELPHFVERFTEEIPMYRVRHTVRPGITGWSQVNGLRGDTDISERVRYDIWYIENWSVSLDIKIIFRTIFGGMINEEKIK